MDNDSIPDKHMAIPPDLISIETAARLAGWTEPWLLRRMSEFGVTRVGMFLDYSEYKAFFRAKAQMKTMRRRYRQRPSTIAIVKQTGAHNVREVMAGLGIKLRNKRIEANA